MILGASIFVHSDLGTAKKVKGPLLKDLVTLVQCCSISSTTTDAAGATAIQRNTGLENFVPDGLGISLMIPTWIDGEKELLAVAPTSTKVHITIAMLESGGKK